MKYGPIICDPTSEEAKRLIGKKVVASDYYTRISEISELMDWDPLAPIEGQLIEVSGTTIIPFRVKGSVSECAYTFIREVIEEPPQYRPYVDTTEMAEDFKKRFCSHTTIPQYAMPLIWLTPRGGGKHLVTDFSCSGELIKCMDGYESLDEVFDLYTYLDGSPVGKEEA